MPQKSQTSLMSVAHVAPPSTAANRAEIDDDDEHRSAEQKNGGTEQAGQERSGLFDVDRSTDRPGNATKPADVATLVLVLVLVLESKTSKNQRRLTNMICPRRCRSGLLGVSIGLTVVEGKGPVLC
jgi:hypothetical protein